MDADVREPVRRGVDETVVFATYDMGESTVDLTKALRLAGELEDQELLSQMTRGA